MNRALIQISILFLLQGCVSKHQPKDEFTYNLQFREYENDQVDDKGPTNLANILTEFRTFPWKEQIEKMNQPNTKSNPTIGIKDLLNEYDFGITAYPDDSNNVVFVIYHSYKIDGDWEESFREGYEKVAVEHSLKLFFERKHDELLKYLIENSKREFGTPLFSM
jgi:hypothetical protein